jgi:hypothetical protein
VLIGGQERGALLIGVGRFPPEPLTEEASSSRRGWDTLPFAHARVTNLADVLAAVGYAVRTLLDPDRATLASAVDAFLTERTQCAIVHVVSHGHADPSQPDRLDAVPACGTMGMGTNVGEWVSTAQTGVFPTLFLVDLCRAGRAARPSWLQHNLGENIRAWVIAAAWRDEDAYDGLFSAVVADISRRCAIDGLDTDQSRRYVAFERFAALIGDEVSRRSRTPQTVTATPVDPAQPVELPFFPNPRYQPEAEQKIQRNLDDLLSTFLRDQRFPDAMDSTSRIGLYFTGRETYLRRLAAWIDGAERPEVSLMILTGAPGTGKSALLGALVRSVHPQLLALFQHARNCLRADLRPSRNEMFAAVDARRHDINELVISIARQLKLSEPAAGWNAAALVKTVRELATPTPTMVVDGFDESAQSHELAALLILPLANARRRDGSFACRILVASRPWDKDLLCLPGAPDRATDIIDLSETTADELSRDLRVYLTELLGLLPIYAEPRRRQMREHLASSIASRLAVQGEAEWGAFLVAGIYADYLGRVEPADEFSADVPLTLPEVLKHDLQIHDQPEVFRAVLTAIAFGHGEGMPAEVIDTIVNASAPSPITPAQVRETLTAARFYLRQSVDRDGTTLYSLFHAGLTDYLRRNVTSAPEIP